MTEDAREPDDDSRPGSRRAIRREREAERRNRRRRVLTSVGFGTVLTVLIAAIPVLALVGRHLIENSQDGKVLNSVSDPKAPGYEALVDPTPTALVVQTDPQGKVNGATILALGSGDAGGGSVILVPLDTRLREPGSGVDRLRTAYEFGGVQILRDQIGSLLGIGFGEVIELGDARWAELTRPVGSITFDNPDSVTAADGTEFASGTLTLRPDQVGPFLAATDDNESDLNRLVRQQFFWKAWLAALAKGGDGPGLVPGEAASGMSRYVRTLARATSDVSILAVNDNPDRNGPPFVLDDNQARLQVAVAVPFPVGAFPGQRTRVRLLNGVRPGPVSSQVTDAVVLGGGEITALGNAAKFDQSETRIEYYTKGMRDRARILQASLGFGKLVYRPQPDQSVDVTVVIGSDARVAPATRPATTVPTTVDTGAGSGVESGSPTSRSEPDGTTAPVTDGDPSFDTGAASTTAATTTSGEDLNSG